MKRGMLTAAAVGLLGLAPAALAGPSFTTVVDNLDVRKNTKLHAREYCKSVRGEDVSWSGVVYDVRGGKTRAKVYVADKSRPLYNGYNIVVTTNDLEKAASIKRGQHVSFKGSIDSCTLKNAGAVVGVDNADIK